MSDAVDVALTGIIQPGTDINIAISKLADLIGVDIKQARALVTGKPITIRQGIQRAEALRLVALLEDAGLMAAASTPIAVATTLEGLSIAADFGAPPRQDSFQASASDPALRTLQTPSWEVVKDADDHVGDAHRRGADRQVDTELYLNAEQREKTRFEKETPAWNRPQAAESQRELPPLRSEPIRVSAAPGIIGLSSGGRLGRLQYLAYCIILLAGLIPALILSTPILIALHGSIYVFVLLAAWLLLRPAILRLHDIGLNGGWLLLSTVGPAVLSQISISLGMIGSVLSLLFSLALCIIPGQLGENKYGFAVQPPGLIIKVLGVIGLIATIAFVPYALRQGYLHRYLPTHGGSSVWPAGDDADDGANSTESSEGENGPGLVDSNGNPISETQLHAMAEQMRANGIHISDEELKAQLRKKARRSRMPQEDGATDDGA